ncbi:MAG: hypothetical protein KDF60_05675 [Calditrichaeota bacterium]|nr:hypothetical protein [Calditrichota bacterium]
MHTKIDISEFFDFPSEQDWHDAAEKLLKGRSFEKTLLTMTDEGILVNPIYHSLPEKVSSTAGISANDWHIAQTLFAENDSLNLIAEHALKNGQDALSINLDFVSQYSNTAAVVPVRNGNVHITGPNSLKSIFSGIDLEKVPVFFDAYCTADKIYAWLKGYLQERNIDLSFVKGGLGSDPLTAAIKYGGFPDSINSMIKSVSNIFDTKNNFDVITIATDYIHNCGSNKIQDLAYIVSAIVYYLNSLQENGLTPQQVLSKTRIKIAVGSDQLMEIASIRALKILWQNLCNAFEAVNTPVKIDAVTSWRSMSYFDPWSNLLRATGQAFSAACGGVDSIDVLPFDIVSGKCTDFSRRIARNIQLILKKESHLSTVSDPAAGSYSFENLSNELASKAWDLFQEIEKSGGILEQIQSGSFQKRIKANASKQNTDWNHRKNITIGTNVYVNNSEKRPFGKTEIISVNFLTHPSQYPVPSLKEKRLSEHFEKLRITVELLADKPVVYLYQLGEVRDYKARSDFSAGFFATAGVEIKTVNTINDITSAGTNPVIILCSSDALYESSAIILTHHIKSEFPGVYIILAGTPGNMSKEYSKAGINDFINRDTNLYEKLKFILTEVYKVAI